MEEKDLWMKKLKEKLEDYSEPIPSSGWEELEKALTPTIEKRIFPYRKWMATAAAVLLAVASSVSLYLIELPTIDEMHHTQTPASTPSPNTLPNTILPDTRTSTALPVRKSTSKRTSTNTLAKADVERNEYPTQENQENKENKQPTTDTETKKSEIETTRIEKSNEPQEKQANKPRSRRPSGKDKLHLPVDKPTSDKGTWSVGVSVGNSGGASTEIGSEIPSYMSRVNMLSVANGLLAIPNDQTLVFEEGVPYLRKVSEIIDIKHHQPVSFGLSVRRNLGKRFSLETGLTYTLLSSDAKLKETDRSVEQKLHYLGIPLRANWNFLDKKLFTLYVSGGGMVEKCIYGKLGSEKETVAPLQFSVSGAVGTQVNVTKRFGIYVEPGVAYFFDDGSDVQTIRKETPFNFNIQAGIRLTY